MKIWKIIFSICALITFIVLGPLSFNTRGLSKEELSVAELVFLDSVDLNRVRINYGGPLTLIYPGVTVGNTVSFPVDSYNFNEQNDQALLMHELTHVWQYQNHGWSYLFRALYEEIFEANAYAINYDPQMSFFDYDVEEQCEIVAEYFLSDGTIYGEYITELQRGSI
jgi:hypothetical protein